jgi:GGDEF domain-containing protein
MMSNNQRINAQKDELIHKLAWYQNYGCYNRGGLEHVKWPEKAHKAVWIVYFDVDGVHEINEQHGTYDAFNAMMKDVLSKFRSDEMFAAIYNSGDEFILCITEEPAATENDRRKKIDPEKVVKRLTEELARHGLTAIFAIEPVKSLLLEDNVKPAADRVLAAKKARGGTR